MKTKTIKINKNVIWWILGIVFLIWLFWPVDYSNEIQKMEKIKIEEDNFKDSFESINELHWDHMPLTYQLRNNGDCGGLQISKMLEALELLENRTNGYIKFIETNETDLDLIIQCLDVEKIKNSYFEEIERLKNSKKLNYITKTYNPPRNSISTYEEGILNKSEHLFINATKLNKETWIIYYLNKSDINQSRIKSYDIDNWKDISGDTLGDARPLIIGNKIVNATINLYKPEFGWTVCTKFPAKEMHELLHVFGFGHSYEPYWDPYEGYSDWSYAKDIMFPYNYCVYQTEIQEKYISCLKYIYSNGEVGYCSEVNFLSSFDEEEYEYGCDEGWHPVEGIDYCCPEPNMFIDEEGYCDYV